MMRSENPPPTRRDRYARVWAIVLGSLLVATAFVACYATYRHEVVPHDWGVVRRGILYRSGQPRSSLQWDFIYRRNIRAIVDLCSRREDPSAFEEERQACAAAGIRLLSIPVTASLPADEQIRQFLQVMRGGKKVLVHCQYGRGRTGIMVAAYRVVIEDRSADQALHEMLDQGWRPEDGNEAEARDLLTRLQRDRGQWLETTSLPAPVN